MTEPVDDDMPVARDSAPPLELADEYEQMAPGFWLATALYFDLAGDDVTVASLSWDGDRPGGADGAWLDRHGDHYVYGSTWTDGPQYVGRFAATADAVDAAAVDAAAAAATTTTGVVGVSRSGIPAHKCRGRHTDGEGQCEHR